MKRVFLMNPPSELYRRDDRCQSKVDDQTVRVVFPPIELGVLASIARRHGAEVTLRDYPTVHADMQDFLADVEPFRPDVVLLNTTAHTIRQDLELFREAKRLFPDVVTIAKGEAVAVQADKTLSDFPHLDIIFDGECEEAFDEIIAGRPWPEIRGLHIRGKSGAHLFTGERQLLKDLDTLPLPARDLFNNDLYRSPENQRPITAIYAQRGCPSKCIFCPAGSMYGYAVRERTVESVMKELRECVETYGIRDFLFHGDTFTLHKKWIMELCRQIVESGLEIRWGCNSRVDTIDDERAAAMREAGCWVVAFGFEHGNQQMLDNMKKGAKADRAFEATAVCRRNGLKVHGFFVIGLPWETSKTLEETYRYVKRLNPDFFDFNIAYPLPGTEYYEIVQRDGLFELPDPTKGGYAQAAVRTYELTSTELTQWRRNALLRMYSRPSYVLKTMAYAARTGNTRHYARAAFQRLTSLLKISA